MEPWQGSARCVQVRTWRGVPKPSVREDTYMERRVLLSELASVEGDVALHLEHVRKQWPIVVELETCGQDAIQAKRVLVGFEDTLEVHARRRRRIRDELVQLDREL